MRSLVTAAVLAALSLLSGCFSNPSTGRSQLILFSADQITAMGIEAKPQVIEEFGGEVPSAPLRAYIERVGRDVASHVEPQFAGIDWEFITLDSDVLNAFALPGGKVFITRGLLAKFQTEAEVAGVLGHEIGHVTARHVDERLSQAAVAEFGMTLLGTYTESELVRAGASLASSGVLLKFSRDQESEADQQGLKYMTAGGYDPVGMRSVLEVLLEAGRQGSSPPEFFSTHPNPETRIKAITRALDGPYKHTQGDPRYQMFRERFQSEAAPYLRR